MTTRTDRDVRMRLVDLSVLALSALVFGGGYLLASRVDHERALHAPSLAEESAGLALAEAIEPPVPGLQPAPRPTRRVVVVRRTRPS